MVANKGLDGFAGDLKRANYDKFHAFRLLIAKHKE